MCQLLIKENRGGSWLYDFNEKVSYEAPAHIGNTIHSVGVGDVYDIAFVSEKAGSNIAQNIQDFVEMKGVRVPWNERVNYPIYMAAPDFDYVDTEKLGIIKQMENL